MASVNAPLGQLVEIIGVIDALRLVARFGGRAIYLPHPSRVKDHAPVPQAIGVEATRKLAAQWPQAHVMLPLGTAYLRRQRDAAMRADSKEMSASALAGKYKTTERHVWRVLANKDDMDAVAAAATAQHDLFGG